MDKEKLARIDRPFLRKDFVRHWPSLTTVIFSEKLSEPVRRQFIEFLQGKDGDELRRRLRTCSEGAIRPEEIISIAGAVWWGIRKEGRPISMELLQNRIMRRNPAIMCRAMGIWLLEQKNVIQGRMPAARRQDVKRLYTKALRRISEAQETIVWLNRNSSLMRQGLACTPFEARKPVGRPSNSRITQLFESLFRLFNVRVHNSLLIAECLADIVEFLTEGESAAYRLNIDSESIKRRIRRKHQDNEKTLEWLASERNTSITIRKIRSSR